MSHSAHHLACSLAGLALALAALLIAAATTTQIPTLSGQRIATVDVKAVLLQSRAGKSAQLKFVATVKKARELIEKKTSRLKRLDEALSSSESTSSEDHEAWLKAYKKEKIDLKYLVEEQKQKLFTKQQELTATLVSELQGVVERVAKKEGYQLVLNTSFPSVIYAGTASDITGQIVEAYDEQWQASHQRNRKGE